MNPWEIPPQPIRATEGQTLYLEFDWVDRAGDPATPTEIRVGSYDARTGKVLMAPVVVPGPHSTTSEIVIPPEATACEPGTNAHREVALELAVRFGADQLTIRQSVLVRPMHMV